MIRCSPQDQRGQWPPTPVALGTTSLVPEQEHVNQTLPGVEETLSVKVSSFIACPFSVHDFSYSKLSCDTSLIPVGILWLYPYL